MSLTSDQLNAVLNKCVFSSALKLVKDEPECTLLGREFQTFGAQEEKWCAPIIPPLCCCCSCWGNPLQDIIFSQ